MAHAPNARWQDGDGDIWMYNGNEFCWRPCDTVNWTGGVSGNYDDLPAERWTRLPDANDESYMIEVEELVEVCREVIETDTTGRLTPEIAQRILALVDLAYPPKQSST